MSIQFKIVTLALVLILMNTSIPLAGAQSSSGSSGMAHAPVTSNAVPGTDMDALMKRCADMRKQMKHGAAITPDMRTLMSQCDEMDKTMTAPEQPYTPPAERRR